MNLIITNSSPLIIFGKIRELELLRTIYKKIKIPKEVYIEVVVKGKEKKEFDAFLVENAIKERWIEVEELTKDELKSLEELHKTFELSKGESEAIILAQRYKNCVLILDDLEAREIAKARDIILSDTLIMPLEALVNKKIDYKSFKEIFEKLIDFMKPKSDKVLKILTEAEKWKRQN